MHQPQTFQITDAREFLAHLASRYELAAQVLDNECAEDLSETAAAIDRLLQTADDATLRERALSFARSEYRYKRDSGRDDDAAAALAIVVTLEKTTCNG